MRTPTRAEIAGVLLSSVFGIVFTVVAVKYTRPPKLPPAPPPVIRVETEDVATIEPAPPPVAQTTDEYLCDVYKRTPVKSDGSDFSWKDKAAAKRKNMDVCEYVIGGMSPALKERLVSFGKAADGKGLKWSMLAGFRDDYRQSIATGYKARTGYSQHGGSKVTRGYGDGRAIDITAVGPVGPVLALIDSMGRGLGLTRPYKGNDPNHVQLTSPARMVADAPARHSPAKVKVAKKKVRYVKRVRVAVRQPDYGWEQPRRRSAF